MLPGGGAIHGGGKKNENFLPKGVDKETGMRYYNQAPRS
jgi:hypothetical protein